MANSAANLQWVVTRRPSSSPVGANGKNARAHRGNSTNAAGPTADPVRQLGPGDERRTPRPPGMTSVSMWRKELRKQLAVMRNPDTELKVLAPSAAIVTL